MIAMTPREIPTPSPIFKPLSLPDSDSANSGVGVTFEVFAWLVDATEVCAVVIIVGSSVAVIDVVVLWETEAVAEAEAVLRVAPRGVIKSLVATIVFNSKDDPTSSEYSGKKSRISWVLTPVVQLQDGPSAQQYVSEEHRKTVLWIWSPIIPNMRCQLLA